MAIKIVTIVGLLFAAFLYETLPFVLDQKNTLTFYDVGQGDAIHLRTQNGFDVLIDAGPNDLVVQKLRDGLPWSDRSIEVLVITHFDSDHVTGLLDLLESYNITTIVLNTTDVDTSLAKNILKKIEEKNIDKKFPKDNEKLVLENGMELQFFHTQPNPKFSDNDRSLSVRIKAGDETFLLTGDLEKEGEHAVLQEKIFIKSNVFKAGHHGSKTSTNPEFLQAIYPKETVLSYGMNNKYGHPAESVVRRLKEGNITMKKTAEQGDITYVLGKEP